MTRRNRLWRRALLLLGGLVGLAGCGHEIARVRLVGEGAGASDVQVTVDRAGQRLGFGVRLDASSRWPLAPAFAIELRDAAGAVVGRTTCDLRRDRISRACSSSFRGRSHTEEHCGYGTSCRLVAPAAGVFTVHAELALAPDPEARIEHLELVVKR